MGLNMPIGKVAILGSGVMGAQIAAHCINCGIPVILFDLPTKDGESKLKDKSAIANKAIENLKKQSPPPLAISTSTDLIQAANYEDDLALLMECDLVIEAIAEQIDWKHDLYKKVTPYLSATAIFATNTSGLSITKLAEGFIGDLKKRFCGIHFFNPPRYMHLVEIIPTKDTDIQIIDHLETFVTSVLGKGVIRATDTPNFIANRIGVFSILSIFSQAKKYQIGIDVVDILTGSKLGRAKSGTYRTCDIVGLDTMASVVAATAAALNDDPFFELFAVPAIVTELIKNGYLGQKTKKGFYQKKGDAVLVFDQNSKAYVPAIGQLSPVIGAILQKPMAERMGLLRANVDPQSQFLWSIFRDIFHYVAVHLETVAESAREIDFAMRWGYGWKLGPFEDWQAAGWLKIANWVEEDIAQGKALSNVPLPAWVFSSPVAESQKIHTPEGSWSARDSQFIPRSILPVYEKQVFRAPLSGEGLPDPQSAGITIFINDAVRIWVASNRPTVLILSFLTKMNTINPDVLNGIKKSIEIAEELYDGLVIWQPASLKLDAAIGAFSAGANLEVALLCMQNGGPKEVEAFVNLFQHTMMRIKYSRVPVVCAISGIALGGGCELIMQSAKRVAQIESYIGLVETRVGLIPSGGGLKEIAIRVHDEVGTLGTSQYLAVIKPYFDNVVMAKISTSAQDALKMGYLKTDDVVAPNPYEILAQAQVQVLSMRYAGYRAPMPRLISVAGRSVATTIMGQMVNMRDGDFISEHDYWISKKIIDVITGGEVDCGTLVSEDWLLKLERLAFIELMGHPKTMERILSFLKTGKPIKN